jgi:hypothetical protein
MYARKMAGLRKTGGGESDAAQIFPVSARRSRSSIVFIRAEMRAVRHQAQRAKAVQNILVFTTFAERRRI